MTSVWTLSGIMAKFNKTYKVIIIEDLNWVGRMVGNNGKRAKNNIRGRIIKLCRNKLTKYVERQYVNKYTWKHKKLLKSIINLKIVKQ